MLIGSPRHTAADLELWGEMERADLVHARAKSLAKRAYYALAAVRGFIAAGPCYAGVSWGKDSVVLADFVCRANRLRGDSIPLVWVRVEPIVNPDCVLVRDEFFRTHDAPYHEIVVECERDEAGWHASGTLEAGFARAVEIVGTRRYLSGVRAEESGARTISARTYGRASVRTCRPLIDWSAQDIYGWLAGERLPVHPAYAMIGGGRWPRERIRVASLAGRRGDGLGRADWEAEYYGGDLRRLARFCV